MNLRCLWNEVPAKDEGVSIRAGLKCQPPWAPLRERPPVSLRRRQGDCFGRLITTVVCLPRPRSPSPPARAQLLPAGWAALDAYKSLPSAGEKGAGGGE